MCAQPFFALTAVMVRGARDHDFETLAGLCEEDFGIVEIKSLGARR